MSESPKPPAPQKRVSPRAEALGIVAITLAVICFFFLFEGRYGLNLADEGFLWYGARRVLAGEVPLRDFQAYDPGRYYWEGAFMLLFGQGPMGLRVGLAAAHAVALWAALSWLRRSGVGLSWLPLAAVTVGLWLQPRHKAFEPALSALAVVVVASLLPRPSSRSAFWLGLAGGVFAFFGRNHAAYLAVAALGALAGAWLDGWRPTRQWLGALGLGALFGALPLAAFLAAVPGFATAYLPSIATMAANPNLPLPVPWPWLRADAGGLERVRHFLVGLCFVWLLCMPLLAVASLFFSRLRVDARLVAPAWVAAAYAHHGFSRADLPHLAQSILPALLVGTALLRLVRSERLWLGPLAAAGAVAASLIATQPVHPWWVLRQGFPFNVAGDELIVGGYEERLLTTVGRLADRFGASPPPFLAPDLPGIYAAFDWRAPTWQLYFLFPATPAEQKSMIDALRKAPPAFGLWIDSPRDGRPELRLSHTHGDVLAFLTHTMHPVLDGDLPGN